MLMYLTPNHQLDVISILNAADRYAVLSFISAIGYFMSGSKQVWTGTVIYPEQAEDEAVRWTVSMAWGEVCDTEASVQVFIRSAMQTVKPNSAPLASTKAQTHRRPNQRTIPMI